MVGGYAPRYVTDSRLYRLSSRRAYFLGLRAMKASHDVRALLRPPSHHHHDPYRVLCVEPGAVTHLVAQRLPSRLAGRSLGGEWDAALLPLTATAVYRGLRQRFVAGMDWADTELHPARYSRRCDNEPPQYERYTEEEFLRRGAALDRLYARLSAQGYLDHERRGEPVGTEMSVTISRGGTYARHSGGLHRLVMAQLIGLPAVPLRVFALHEACVGTAADPFRAERPAGRGPGPPPARGVSG